MKNLLPLLTSLFLISVILVSCTKEVQIDIPPHEEKIVIDGSIETGQPPIIFISKSNDIYSPTNFEAFLNGFISGATVSVSNGTNTIVLDELCSNNLPPGTEQAAAELLGIPEDQLASLNICAYTSFDQTIWGELGKTYDLNVSYDGKTYTSQTTIYNPIALDSVYWKEEENYPGYGFSWAHLTDPPNENNAYLWEVKKINQGSQGGSQNEFFVKTFGAFFNDLFFDGMAFEFYYENPTNNQNQNQGNTNETDLMYAQGDTVVVKFSSLGDREYEFFDKKYRQIYSAGSPFSTPINVPSNIDGGALGIWAGFSPVYDTLICQP